MAAFTVRVFYSTPTVSSPKELTKVVEAASVVDAINKVLTHLSDKNRVIYLTARAESGRKAKFPDSATPPPQIGRFPGIVP
jgi:hypothetical protein